MKKTPVIFFDVGGVCLTDGWDHISREKATKKFSFDYEEMEKRHRLVFKKFEKGKLSLDQYLNEVIFFRKRNFTEEDFTEFMFAQSKPINTTLRILEKLSDKYQLFTLNNESKELNKFRINKFGLDRYFDCFFSSCYLGVRKPEPEIFYKALHILHKEPDECLFIDDREENYQSARSFGLNSILLDEPGSLGERLKTFGIEI